MSVLYDQFKKRCDYIRQFINIIDSNSHNRVFIEDANIVLDIISKIEFDNVSYAWISGLKQFEHLMFYDFVKHRDKDLSYQDFVKQFMPHYSKEDLIKRYIGKTSLKFSAGDLLCIRAKHIKETVYYLATIYDFLHLAGCI
jgi:hypothetical protein